MRPAAAVPIRNGGALAAIGNTPLVPLSSVYRGPGQLWGKLEMLNPGGSVKDRAAQRMLQDALAQGQLSPGQGVVEMTSGNLGAGLAVVAAVLGHPLTAVMSAGNSPARARMLDGLGAEVVLVPQVDGTEGQVTGADIAAAARHAQELARQRGAFYVDQFRNPSGVMAHEEGTGPEIWQQLGGRLDGFVAAVGSGGTLIGASRYFKRQQAAPSCYAVEPASAAVLSGEPVHDARHLLQGAGYGLVPEHWQPELVDGVVTVSDRDARQWRRRLAHEEGLFAGYTAAANVAASCKLMAEGVFGPEPQVATVICDSGLKYFD